MDQFDDIEMVQASFPGPRPIPQPPTPHTPTLTRLLAIISLTTDRIWTPIPVVQRIQHGLFV